MEKITLVFYRADHNLWIVVEGEYITCIWNVTGLEWVRDSEVLRVRILQNGKQIGNLWEVGEIREKW